jgi:VCBS repeat-containing protein
MDVDSTLSAVAQTLTTANGGSVTINADGTFSYQGATNFNGADSFSYTATDGQATSTANVTINLAAVNDAPVANDDSFLGNEDQTVVQTFISYTFR